MIVVKYLQLPATWSSKERSFQLTISKYIALYKSCYINSVFLYSKANSFLCSSPLVYKLHHDLLYQIYVILFIFDIKCFQISREKYHIFYFPFFFIKQFLLLFPNKYIANSTGLPPFILNLYRISSSIDFFLNL